MRGHIRKKGTSWQACVKTTDPVTGKARQLTAQRKTKREAESELIRLLAIAGRTDAAASSATMADLLSGAGLTCSVVAAPTFSVIIPAYNAAETIPKAVLSACTQTFPAHEVVVCDDGSTDDFDAAIATWRDDIVLVRQANKGLSHARNAAIAASTGEWVVLLDADDAWQPGRLAVISELIQQRPELDIVTTDAEVINPAGHVTGRYYASDFVFPAFDDQPTAILRRNFIFVSAAIRRSALEAVGGFDESSPAGGEYEAWVRIILSGGRAGYDPRPLARYMTSPGGLTARAGYTRASIRHVLERVLAENDLTEEQRRIARDRVATIDRVDHRASVLRELSSGTMTARRAAMGVAVAADTPIRARARYLALSMAPRRVARAFGR